MPDTPLNPDALENARSATFDCWESGGNMDDLAECAIEAYLAVAQPVVTSVEELDKLPVGSVFLDGTFGKWVFEKVDDSNYQTTGVMQDMTAEKISLPARVLYRPEVNDA